MFHYVIETVVFLLFLIGFLVYLSLHILPKSLKIIFSSFDIFQKKSALQKLAQVIELLVDIRSPNPILV